MQVRRVLRKLRDRYYNYTAAFKSDYKITDSKTLSLSAAYDRYDKYKYYVLLNEKEKSYENSILRVGAQYNQTLFEKHSLVAGAEGNSDELLSFRFTNQGTEEKEKMLRTMRFLPSRNGHFRMPLL